MLTELELYWITRLDSICGFVEAFCTALAIILIFGGVFAVIAFIMECVMKTDAINFRGANHFMEDELYMNAHSIRTHLFNVVLKCILPLFMLASLAHILTPTTKEYCAIKVVPAIVNNEKAQELTNELYSLGVEWLKELKPVKANTTDAADPSTQN